VDKSGLGIFAHPDNLNAWAEFIHQLAMTFRPFDPIGYEIWNEENSRDFWDRVGIRTRTPQPPCPTCWTRLYCLAVDQIDANDPGRAVGVGGLAAHHTNESVTLEDGTTVLKNMQSSLFLRRAYAARRTLCAGKPFDYVGYHPYAKEYWEQASPPASVADTDAIKELWSVRGVMRAHRQGFAKVWNTEWGFPSDFNGIDEADQSRLILEEHTYLANRARDLYGPYMRFSILFNPIDAPADDVFSHIGVVALGQPPEDTTQWRNKISYGTWTSLPQP
jgi:hypothetical protein